MIERTDLEKSFVAYGNMLLILNEFHKKNKNGNINVEQLQEVLGELGKRSWDDIVNALCFLQYTKMTYDAFHTLLMATSLDKSKANPKEYQEWKNKIRPNKT